MISPAKFRNFALKIIMNHQFWTVMKIDIENGICLGISHSGAVMTEETGILELDDNEVSLLINIIKEKKNCDVDELEIEESHPDLYEKRRQAYYDMAYKAEELHWL